MCLLRGRSHDRFRPERNPVTGTPDESRRRAGLGPRLSLFLVSVLVSVHATARVSSRLSTMFNGSLSTGERQDRHASGLIPHMGRDGMVATEGQLMGSPTPNFPSPQPSHQQMGRRPWEVPSQTTPGRAAGTLPDRLPARTTPPSTRPCTSVSPPLATLITPLRHSLSTTIARGTTYRP